MARQEIDIKVNIKPCCICPQCSEPCHSDREKQVFWCGRCGMVITWEFFRDAIHDIEGSL